jgi:hypothetical protein
MAYVTIPALPAGTALTGLEQFEAVQSATSVKLTAAQLKTFTSTTPNFITDDAVNAGVTNVVTITHTTSGTPAIGIGTGLAFATESSTLTRTGSVIQSVSTNITPPNEAFDIVFQTMAGSALGEVARLTSTKRLGVGTASPATGLQTLVDDANNNTVTEIIRATHTTSGVPGAGIGTSIGFEAETSAGNNELGATLSAVTTGVGLGAENFQLAVNLMSSGAAVAEVARFTQDKKLGIGTSTPGAPIEAVVDDANTSSIISAGRFTHTTSGTPAVGIGTAIDFQTETSAGTNKLGGAVYTTATSLTFGSENFDMGLAVMQQGVASTEVMRLQAGTATTTARVGINTTSPGTTLAAVLNDTATNTVSSMVRLTHTTSGVPAIGIGNSIELETETSNGNLEVGVVLSSVAAVVTLASEVFDFVISTVSAGAAATEKLRVGDFITAAVPFGVGTTADAVAWFHVAAGTATRAPMDWDPGVLLTTDFQGAQEFDGTAMYFSPQALQRGLIPSMQTYQLGADYVGNGAITTTQTIFNKAVSVAASTRYAYELNLTITNTAVTAKTLQYAVAGSATLSAHDYEVISMFAATAVTPTASTLMQNRITAGFATLVSVSAASGAAAGAFTARIRGTFDVLAAGQGTVNFQFGLTAVGTVVTVIAGSSASVWSIGPIAAITTDTDIGSWA